METNFHNFAEFASVARALGSQHRLEILEHLAQGERGVEALAERVGLSIANASQHLQQLRRAGMVTSRRDGKFVLYRLADEAVLGLIAALSGIAERNLAEVDRIRRTYFFDRDNMEPVSREELLQRTRSGLVTVLDVRPADELFATFDPSPVAAASLSQVHRATLPDGAAVAVKVRRPDVETLITRDLDALGFGLRVAQRLFPRRLARTNLRAFFTEFRRYTLNELDFAREGKVIDRFRANFAQSPDVRLPGVHWQCSSKRVLTTDWVEGMRVHEAAQALNPETRDALVVRLVNMLVQMFVSDGLFHADLHPGNIFFHEDGSFTLLDFGMYGELTPAQQDRFILYLFAVVQQQTSRAFHHFKAQTTSLPNAAEGAFASKFAALADRFYASPLAEMSFAKVYLEMMKAGYDFGFAFPSQLMLHAKALTTAEALIFVLAPDARFEKLARPVVAQKYAERATSLELLKRRASQLLPELLLLGELPPPDAVDDVWDQNATAEILAEL